MSIATLSEKINVFDSYEDNLENLDEFMELFTELEKAFNDVPDVRVVATLEDEYYISIWSREKEGEETGDFQEIENSIIMFPLLDSLYSLKGYQFDLVVSMTGGIHDPVMHESDRVKFGNMCVDTSMSLREYAQTVRRFYDEKK